MIMEQATTFKQHKKNYLQNKNNDDSIYIKIKSLSKNLRILVSRIQKETEIDLKKMQINQQKNKKDLIRLFAIEDIQIANKLTKSINLISYEGSINQKPPYDNTTHLAEQLKLKVIED